MRLGASAHRGGCVLLFVALACLGLGACGAGDTSGADHGTPRLSTVVSSPAPHATATRAVVGPVAVTATPSASGTVSGSAAALTCAVRSAEGSDDDETQHTLTCTVKHAPRADTRFSLHYGVRDPVGNLHPLTPACTGALHDGAGTCSQTYEFVFAFTPVPAPVTGESLPSHTALGPAAPSY